MEEFIALDICKWIGKCNRSMTIGRAPKHMLFQNLTTTLDADITYLSRSGMKPSHEERNILV